MTASPTQTASSNQDSRTDSVAAVNSRSSATAGSPDTEDTESDPDLKRAKDLVELHYQVKVKHSGGLDKELLRAREDVERVMRDLGWGA